MTWNELYPTFADFEAAIDPSLKRLDKRIQQPEALGVARFGFDMASNSRLPPTEGAYHVKLC